MDRRAALTLMRSSLAFGAIGTAAALTQCQPTAAPAATARASPGLLALIADHERAVVEWHRSIDAEDAFTIERRSQVRTLQDAGVAFAEYDALDEALRASPRALEVQRILDETSHRETALLEEVLAYPVATPADLRAKLEHLLSQPDQDESFGAIDHPTTILMRSIVGGGLV